MIIAGAGGYGCEVAELLGSLGIDVTGAVDDGSPRGDRLEAVGLRFLGAVESAADHGSVFVVGIGYPRPRAAVAARLEQLGLEPCAPLIDQRSAFLGQPEIGAGSVVMPNVTISRGVRAGQHLLANYNSSIGHDTECGQVVTVGPNASIGGECSIGDQVLIGSGAVVLQGISIGDGAVIGSGAVVTKDVSPGTTVVGVPAQPNA